jgi:hypothetical protein
MLQEQTHSYFASCIHAYMHACMLQHRNLSNTSDPLATNGLALSFADTCTPPWEQLLSMLSTWYSARYSGLQYDCTALGLLLSCADVVHVLTLTGLPSGNDAMASTYCVAGTD